VQLLHCVISSSVPRLITGLFNAVWLMPYWNQHPVLQPGYRKRIFRLRLFSVASYNRPAMRKKWLFVCQCRPYQLTGNSLAYVSEELHYLTVTVLNPRYKLRLADDSVKKDNADHRAHGSSFPSQVTVLISQFQSTDDRWQPAFSIWRPACWLSCTVTSARISQQQANLNKLSKLE